MKDSVDVAIIGAGQAGLATSWHLKQAGVDHCVLEAGRVAETWRTRRWDSFRLVTPNRFVLLPGAEYKGRDPDGLIDLAQLIDHLQSWADSFEAPVEENTQVMSLEAEGSGFRLALRSGAVKARRVVVASAAAVRAAIGPHWSPKWSGIHRVE